MKPLLTGSKLKHRIKFQTAVSDNSFDGAGSGLWNDFGDPVPAEVQDVLPSRGEKLADGLNIASRPARVRIRYRTDIKSSMRVLIGATIDGEWVTYRTAEIVSVPIELGFRQGLEFMIEDYSVSGSTA